MRKSIEVTFNPDGTISLEHVGTVGVECLADTLSEELKKHSLIIKKEDTKDYRKTRPVQDINVVKVGR